MKAKVDQNTCISCGMCEGMAPDVFRMKDDGTAEAYKEVEENEKELVQEAIDSCPVSAICWED